MIACLFIISEIRPNQQKPADFGQHQLVAVAVGYSILALLHTSSRLSHVYPMLCCLNSSCAVHIPMVGTHKFAVIKCINFKGTKMLKIVFMQKLRVLGVPVVFGLGDCLPEACGEG